MALLTNELQHGSGNWTSKSEDRLEMIATPSGRVQVSRGLVNGWEKKAAGDWWIDWCGIAVMQTLYRSDVVKRELSMKVKLLFYITTLTCVHRFWVVTERMRFRVSAVWLVLWVEPLLLHTELAFDSDASWDPSGWSVLGMSNWEEALGQTQDWLESCSRGRGRGKQGRVCLRASLMSHFWVCYWNRIFWVFLWMSCSFPSFVIVHATRISFTVCVHCYPVSVKFLVCAACAPPCSSCSLWVS